MEHWSKMNKPQGQVEPVDQSSAVGGKSEVQITPLKANILRIQEPGD